jgi:hypothetical protein
LASRWRFVVVSFFDPDAGGGRAGVFAGTNDLHPDKFII